MVIKFDNDIVISGISGRLPLSSNIEEFKENLMNKIDMVTDDDESRWLTGTFGLPSRLGKIKELDRFDASFFKVHTKLARVMDPQIRMILEATYEAIIDAGVNPSTLRGSRTGVFVGASTSDAQEFWMREGDEYGLLGSLRTMLANRISFVFDFIGPSYTIDTACSSAFSATHQAVVAIRSGECESAIVGGIQIMLDPGYTINFHKLKTLSQDGKCKSFDSAADGYVRSDAVVAIYLQKATDARRVYASVIGTKVLTDGYKPEGITYPNGNIQYQMMHELYNELGINPAEVAYVETHGTGTKTGDPIEANVIDQVFCQDRKTPLLMGSVKSNMGHSESASGLCSVAKVLIAMESGMIPANLHYINPHPDIPGLADGRIRVIENTTPWNGGIVSVNAFGFGGTNSHIVLRSNPKLKLSPTPDTTVESLPKLIAVSGSTEEAVKVLLDKANECGKDDEFISLLHAVYRDNIPGHRVRGYEILNGQDTRELGQIIDSEKRRPIWFVFSGMGTQWPGMGLDLLNIEKCRCSLRRCADALKSHGIDLMDIMVNATDKTYENVVNSLITIVAIQIALVDLLASLGIHPDGVIGHSVGEVGCGYADGTLTLEQTILIAYCRGKALVDSKLKLGGMAAVGLSWEEAKKICPADISVACHNSADLVTVSGPAESVQKFAEELKSKDIFSKTVNSSGIPFHSKHIASCIPLLRTLLDRVLPNPQKRTDKWISTSVAEAEWTTNPRAQFNSAEYHTNNMLSPVLFHEAVQHIPEDAIIIEIAPHCLMQSILRRSLPSRVTNVSLQHNRSENVRFLLSNLGKLYMAGGQPDISKLYKAVSFPVSRGTPMIAPLVKWDHSVKWDVPNFKERSKLSEQCIVEVDLSEEENAYLLDHKIDGRAIVPASCYIHMVWRTFAKLRGVDFEWLPVIFENVRFRRITILLKTKPLKFSINILEGTGDFEICEANTIVVSGNIRAYNVNNNQSLPMLHTEKNLPLNTDEIYKELRLRGYEFGNSLRTIKCSGNYCTVGEIVWDKWPTFIDGVLQFNLLSNNRQLSYMSQLQQILIDPIENKRLTDKLTDGDGIPVYVYKNADIVKSGGVEVRGLKYILQAQRIQIKPKLERYTFVPYENPCSMIEDPKRGKVHALTVLLQIVRENAVLFKMRAVEFAGDRAAKGLLAPFILDILREELSLNVELQVAVVSSDSYAESLKEMNLNVNVVKIDLNNALPVQDAHLAIAADILSKKSYNILKNLAASLRSGCFILLEETATQLDLMTALEETDLMLVGKQIDSVGKSYLLLKKGDNDNNKRESIVVHVMEENYSWLENMKSALKRSEGEGQEVLFVSQGEESNGLIGLINCIRRETTKTRYVFIQDKNAPQFCPSTPFYAKQLNKGLMANVLKEGQWGSYRHLLLDEHNVQASHAYLNTLIKGDLTTLSWIQSPLNYYQPEKFPNTICSVYYAALNVRDIMLVNNLLSLDFLSENLLKQDCVPGLEFSGREPTGRRVMGIVETGGLATTVLTNPGLLWEVPNQWTLEQAATIPVSYATSYYALCVRGKLQAGESVLIHAGTSSVGQAAIAIALYNSCTVFTTTSSLAKKEYLKKIFPQLNDRCMGSSQDTSFEQLILMTTQGRGVDIVLNSLMEDKLQASIRCLAKNGRFLEIGKYNVLNGNFIDMSIFLKNTTFNSVLMDNLFEDRVEQMEVRQLVSEGIKNGVVRPLNSTVFSERHIEQGFRFMSAGKNIGKVLFKIRDEEMQKTVPPPPKLMAVVPRTYMNSEKSYVVIGGLGGCGLELANWMITRGAKFIVLVSRVGMRTGYQALCVRRWRESDVTVVISKADTTTLSGAKSLIDESNRLAPVGGIFNLAAVIQDVLIDNMEAADLEAVMLPKVNVTKNLDAVSRKSCPSLDYFVVFSSTVSGRGNYGQANYGFANAAAERIMERRHADGLPGLAIQWGGIGMVGLRPDAMRDEIDPNDTSGVALQSISSCLEVMDSFLQEHHPVLSSIIKNKKDMFAKNDSDSNIVDIIVSIIGIQDTSLVNFDDSFERLGADSLIYTAIRQILEREYNLTLSAKEIRDLSINKLQSLIPASDKSPEAPATSATSEEKSPAAKSNAQIAHSVNGPKSIPSKNVAVHLKTKSERGPILFVVHGIDSLANELDSIASKLERPLWALEGIEKFETVTEIAEIYVNVIRNIQREGPYHLAGYSFGASVAFEIATKLESAGEEVILSMLDGAPYYGRVQLAKKLSKMSPDYLKNPTLRDCITSMAYFSLNFNKHVQFVEVNKILNSSDSDEELIDKMSKLLRDTPLSLDYIKTTGPIFAKKVQSGLHYYPEKEKNKKFKGQITLIKALDTYVDIVNDYNLSMVCTEPVKIYEVPGTHLSMLSGEGGKSIANILQYTS